jgi:hypothetical protein
VTNPELLLELTQSAVLLVTFLLVLGLSYVVGDMNRRLGPDHGVLIPNDGLELGEAAPELRATDRRSGAEVDLAAVTDRAALVAFLSAGCAPCSRLVPGLNALAARGELRVIVVATDGPGTSFSELLARNITLVDSTGPLVARFRAQRTPMVYLVRDATIAMRGIPNDAIGLEDLVDGVGLGQGDRSWLPAHEEPPIN